MFGLDKECIKQEVKGACRFMMKGDCLSASTEQKNQTRSEESLKRESRRLVGGVYFVFD